MDTNRNILELRLQNNNFMNLIISKIKKFPRNFKSSSFEFTNLMPIFPKWTLFTNGTTIFHSLTSANKLNEAPFFIQSKFCQSVQRLYLQRHKRVERLPPQSYPTVLQDKSNEYLYSLINVYIICRFQRGPQKPMDLLNAMNSNLKGTRLWCWS